jgi:hypothetical protein
MDVIELLKKDHEHVSQLFQQFRGGGGLTGLVKRVTGSQTPGQQRPIAMRICDELDVHARVEEEIFYPAVRQKNDPKLHELLTESEREHATIKERIGQVRDHLSDPDALPDRVSELEDCVKHHVNEEEGEMFPRLVEVMPEAERERIGVQVKARKTALKKSSPRAATPARAKGKRAPARRAAAKSRGRRGKARVAKRSKAGARKKAKKRSTRAR